MSQAFLRDEPLESVAKRAAVIVEAEVLAKGPPPRVKVVRVEKGTVAAGAEIAVLDAGAALWKAIGEAIRAGQPAPSFDQPKLAGKPPKIKPGGRYVFYLVLVEGTYELAAADAWVSAP